VQCGVVFIIALETVSARWCHLVVFNSPLADTAVLANRDECGVIKPCDASHLTHWVGTWWRGEEPEHNSEMYEQQAKMCALSNVDKNGK